MNRSKHQKGSALAIMLILAMGVGSVVTSFLGRTLVEQARVSQRAAAMRAYRQAVGQLELAKAVINASGYAGGNSIAVTDALASNPPVIAGTGVFLEAVGTDRWYRIVSCGEFDGETAAVMAYFRDGTPYVAYNLYVEEQPLGISGKPRGKLHSNEKIQFYFANGYYDDYVSSVDGFEYMTGSGADAANTTFAGGTNPASEVKNLLDLVDYADLRAMASVVTPPDLEAVVTMLKTDVKIDLWSKDTIIQVPQVKTKKVQVGQNWEQVTVTTYTKQYQWVDVQMSQKVWVPAVTGGGGGEMGGGGSATGYWKTVYYYVKQYKLVNVPNGTKQVWKWVPVYQTQSYTVMVNQLVPGTLQSSNTYPVNGQVIFCGDNIKSMSGELKGKLTLVTENDVRITNSMRYIDANNQYAYLDGLNSANPYIPNPAFIRNHALGIIAKGDIRYARTAPASIEVNASLISTAGMVGMEGIVLDANGTPTLSGAPNIKTSIRRLGSIMSSKRPVSTLLDGMNQVSHGFSVGSSNYDRTLVSSAPPGFPSEEIIMWQPNMKASGASFTAAGGGVYDSQEITPITNLSSTVTIRQAVTGSNFDWGS